MAKIRRFSFRINTNTAQQRINREQARAEKKRRERIFKYKQFLADIPKVLSGDIPPDTRNRRNLYNAFWSAVVHSLFTSIYEAYEVKAMGGADELGNTWQPLSARYKAYGRNRRGHLSKSQRSKFNQETPGLLTPKQYLKWKQVFSNSYRKAARNAASIGDLNPTTEKDIKRRAAQIAWANAKNRGAETLLGVLGEADMLIMRETNRLYNSLKPGRISKSKHNKTAYVKSGKDQVVKFNRKSVEIGTKVPYAKMAEGPASRRRAIWPKTLGSWYDRAIEAGRDAMAEVLEGIKP